jgi:sugar phosphate isomerase/epimerase
VKVRIGINPITWTNDDVPELGGDTPLDTCLAETKQAGYAGTELGGKFPRDPKLLKPIMACYGLDVISGWYDGRCAEKEVAAEMAAIGPHLALLKAMGSRHVVYADTSLGRHGAIWGPISERPSLKGEDWPAYGRKLIEDGERKARDILKKNREKLHILAKALLEFETLSGDEVKLVLKGDKIQRDDQGGSKRSDKGSSSVPVTGRPKGGEAPGEMEPQPQS